MIARLAYLDSTVSVCRKHYDTPMRGIPPLGEVQDARGRLCDQCAAVRSAHVCIGVLMRHETDPSNGPDVRRIMRDARMAVQAAVSSPIPDIDNVLHQTAEGYAHLEAWGLD